MAYRNDVPLPVVIPRANPVITCIANDDCCITEAQLLVILAYLLSSQLSDDELPMQASAAVTSLGLSGAPYTPRQLLLAVVCAVAAGTNNTHTIHDLWIAAQRAGWNALSEYDRQLVMVFGANYLIN